MRNYTRLKIYAFATFHTSGLVASMITLLYWNGELGMILNDLNTTIGFFLFASLWTITWFCTKKALSMTAFKTVFLMSYKFKERWDLLFAGFVWGGFNGVIFLFILALLFAVIEGESGIFLLVSIFGSIPAFLIGGFIGLLFSALDVICMEIVDRVFSSCRIVNS